MSEQKKSGIEDLVAQVDAAREEQEKRREIAEKEFAVKQHRINMEHQHLVQTKADEEAAKKVNYARPSRDHIRSLIRENHEYLEAAKRPMVFINRVFDGVVPFHRKNLIMLAGPSGQGKSTTVGNIITTCMAQKINGREPKILVLTNEEKETDVYNRITAFLNGWKYSDHHDFTDEQRRKFDENILVLSERVTVIGDRYEGVSGTTTTIEGLKGVFDSIIDNNIHYDAIILDYYQKVRHSKNDPRLDEWKVQRKLVDMLDTYKNTLPGPIVVMAQCHQRGKDDDTTLETRMKGTKILFEASTFVMEMIRDAENYATIWKVWKARFNSSINAEFKTGYDNGRFVPYDEAFIAKVARAKEQKEYNALFGHKEKKEESK